MKKILFLASGGGGTMKFVHLVSQMIEVPFEIVGVLADRECGSTEYCKKNNIDYKIIEPWKKRIEEAVLYIMEIHPDIVVTNIHKILPREVFTCCNAKFINLHYSLLPSYGGVIGFKTLELAKKNNARIIGATCHEVTEIVDGGKILAQSAMAVDWSRDYNSIGNSIFRMACKTILTEIMSICGMNEEYEANDDFIYSPTLNYDDSFMTEDFWNQIRSV